VPAVRPASIAKFPTILVFPGPATGNALSAETVRQQIVTFLIRVYAMPVAQGKPVHDGMEAAIELMDEIADMLLDADNLVLTLGAGVTIKAVLDQANAGINDSGMARMTYNEIEYYGFEAQVRITGTYSA
jgi:hypothetical protein